MSAVQRFTSSVWKRLSVEVAASSQISADTNALAEFKAVEYIITVYNEAQDKYRSFHLSAIRKSGGVADSVFNKKGDSINYDVSVSISGSDVVLTLDNQESFALDATIYKLIIL